MIHNLAPLKTFVRPIIKSFFRFKRRFEYQLFHLLNAIPRYRSINVTGKGKKKVLFIALGNKPDYLCDMAYHGLKTNEKVHLEVLNPPLYLHRGYSNLKNLYGKGFTLYGKLEGRPERIDRWKMLSRVRKHYYDTVIFGSIHRYHAFVDDIASCYSPENLVFLDGEDHCEIMQNLLPLGKYFKREIGQPIQDGIMPINFCVPEDLILFQSPKKLKRLATIIPGNRQTYLFEKESEYFKDYQNSIFGLTYKKSGWDCLRHYEIIMNGCIPYFPDLKSCPSGTMVLFPKEIILHTNELFEKASSFDHSMTIMHLLEHCRKKLTTKFLANRLINE